MLLHYTVKTYFFRVKQQYHLIVKTLNKILIRRDVCDEHQSIFDDKRHVKLYTEQFQYFGQKCLDEIEHPDLISEWNHNMDTAVYLKQS